ncbi:MAG: hypothetical protein H6686_07660 [Fibrobacteria bacterium]|nr:hypothetical protein [Fibrobacteria bacterium]
MQILPDRPSDFAGANQAVEIQTTLLNKAQDMAKQEMATIMESISSNLPHQGSRVDIRA